MSMRDHLCILFFQGGRSLSWGACEVPPYLFTCRSATSAPPSHGALKWSDSGSATPKQNLLVQCSWPTWPPDPFSHYSAPWLWLALTQLMASGSRCCLNQAQEPECLPFCLRNVKNDVDSSVRTIRLIARQNQSSLDFISAETGLKVMIEGPAVAAGININAGGWGAVETIRLFAKFDCAPTVIEMWFSNLRLLV